MNIVVAGAPGSAYPTGSFIEAYEVAAAEAAGAVVWAGAGAAAAEAAVRVAMGELAPFHLVAMYMKGNSSAQAARPSAGSSLRLFLYGDSNTKYEPFREYLWARLRRSRGGVRFEGPAGVTFNTVDSYLNRRRVLGDWRHAGFRGRRASRSYAAAFDPATDVFTVAGGHDLDDNLPLVLIDRGGLVGLGRDKLLWARDCTPTTFKVCEVPGGAALNLAGAAGAVLVGTGLLELWPAVAATFSGSPDVSVLKVGTNDIAGGVPVPSIVGAVSSLVAAVRARYPLGRVVLAAIQEFGPGTVTGSNRSAWNASRDAYLTALRAMDDGSAVLFRDTSVGVGPMDPDGIHLTKRGAAQEAENLAAVIEEFGYGPNARAVPRALRHRPATASIALTQNGSQVSIPASAELSPGSGSFAVAFWYRPSALQVDSTFRQIVKYSAAHPGGFSIGHFATTGQAAGGGLAVYLEGGSPVILGATSAAYAGEAFKVNEWARTLLVFDRAALRIAAFINAQLVQVAPLAAAWGVPDSQPTYVGYQVFNSALGAIDDYVMMKGVTVDAALEVAELDYYDGVLPRGAVSYPLSEGSGTSAAAAVYGLPAGTLNANASWVAAGAYPKPVDE